MADRDTRGYKVYYKWRDGTGFCPQIKLEGIWLKKLGFNIDARFLVRCEKDRLVLTKAAPQ